MTEDTDMLSEDKDKVFDIKTDSEGKMYTVQGTDPKQIADEVARARKACRDLILGNTPFHTDPFATKCDSGKQKE